MINLLKSIIFIFILGFIFSGCSHKLEVSDSYMEPHINKKAQKVEDFISSVSILENKSNILEKRSERLRAKGTLIKVDHGELNNTVSKSYFSQYFKNVSLTSSKINKDLYIESEILDSKFYFYAFPDGTHVEATLRIKAYYNGDLILDKVYKNEKDITVYLSAHLTLTSLFDETYHEAILNVYKNEFQKDLISVLKTKVTVN